MAPPVHLLTVARNWSSNLREVSITKDTQTSKKQAWQLCWEGETSKSLSLASPEWSGVHETETGCYRKEWERLSAIKNTTAQ